MKLMPLLVLLVLPLTGCLSIKSEGLSQRAPGVVTLGGVVCGSDYNQSSYAGCDDGNVAEPDNRALQGCDADGGAGDPQGCGLTGDGQLLVGFRVPLGSEGPEAFTTDARDLHFERSASYTQQLQARFPAPADEHWVGYMSDVRTFAPGKPAEEPTGIHVEFPLAPKDGPFRWRWVVGFRAVTKAQASTPVDCAPYTGICFDSPPENRIPTDLPAENVSDFAVLPGTQAGEFLVRYADARNLGAQDFAISASTGVPSASTLHLEPNTTAVVTVSVPPGSHAVTLSASTGSPAVTRQATATVTVTAVPAPQPPQQITAMPAGTWTRTKAGVRIRSMRIAGLPAGARVALTCKPCHITQTLTAATTVTLTKLKNQRLKRGQSFTVTVTRTGYIGERVTLTVTKHRFTTRRTLIPLE
jgi:hypothetical protein